ncbi:MAG: TlpA disulfide reductase family protein [Polyangiaceae bacterium]
MKRFDLRRFSAWLILAATALACGASGDSGSAASPSGDVEDDDADGIPAFAKGFGAKFPLVWDSEKSIAAKWQPKSMPTTFIIDRSGIVRFVHFGFHDGEDALIEQEVKSLL